jgi:hypothetical protein
MLLLYKGIHERRLYLYWALTFHFSWLTIQFFCLVLSHDIYSNRICNSVSLFFSCHLYVIISLYVLVFVLYVLYHYAIA